MLPWLGQPGTSIPRPSKSYLQLCYLCSENLCNNRLLHSYFQLCINRHHVCTLKYTMMEVVTPWKLANTVSKGSPPSPREAGVEHSPAHHVRDLIPSFSLISSQFPRTPSWLFALVPSSTNDTVILASVIACWCIACQDTFLRKKKKGSLSGSEV